MRGLRYALAFLTACLLILAFSLMLFGSLIPGLVLILLTGIFAGLTLGGSRT